MKRCLILSILLLVIISLSFTILTAATSPTLILNVMVIGTSTPGVNVVYLTAKLSSISTLNPPVSIKFYNGNPTLPGYPNNYLGSAPVDSTGKALFRLTNHPSGKYTGGSSLTASPWGPINAPVKVYAVP